MTSTTGPADAERFERARRLFLEAVSHHQAGRLEQAEVALLASLQELPGRASTLANLGATRLALGRPQQALADLDAALAVAPGDAQTWCHRGAACAALGRHEEALQAYDEALRHEPAMAAARFHRAALLAGIGRAADAYEGLAPLLDVHGPDAAPAWLLAGQLLQALSRDDEAVDGYRRALALDPGLPRAHALLGQLLVSLGRDAQAREVFRGGAERGAEPELNRYLLAGLEGGEAPAKSPASYVRALFDPYAHDFDAHLVGDLRYRGHEAVVQAAQHARGPGRWTRVLDLGCGTGLCGQALRPQAERVDGVDLSPVMIEAARRSGAYAQLVEADVAEHLEHTPARYDLIVSADVFIYIGDLHAVFAGVRRVLLPQGLFVFTVESLDDDGPARAPLGYLLRPSLRYAHSQSYLRQLAATHGLALAEWQPIVLREEQRRPVAGAVVTLRG